MNLITEHRNILWIRNKFVKKYKKQKVNVTIIHKTEVIYKNYFLPFQSSFLNRN